MANLILLNVTKKITGSVGIINQGIQTGNIKEYSPAQAFALDILNLATPIRQNPDGSTYFGTRNNASQQIENRNVGITYWVCEDTLSAFSSQSQELVPLSVVSRRGVALPTVENMLFNSAKIIEVADIDSKTGYTRFEYFEDGEASLVTYEVTQTPAQMVAGGVSPVYNMDGHDLYVNDVVGNNATAEKGNPLLPWATVTAALAAASAGDVVVVLEGAFSVTNAYKNGVDIELRSQASLIVSAYNATLAGTQKIYGGGTLTITGASGFLLSSNFDGLIKVDVGLVNLNGTLGGHNLSTHNAVFDLTADYVIIGAACHKAFTCGGNGSFNWNVKIKQTDNSTRYDTTFLVAASSANAVIKTFNINIANGTSNASNQGFLCVDNLDDSYIINVGGTIVYDSTNGSPGMNGVFTGINCSGGIIYIYGTQGIIEGRMAIIVDSPLLKMVDRSNTYQFTSATQSLIAMSGGASIFALYGEKRTFSQAESIALGSFTSANPTVDFGPIASTGGSDVFAFKGQLKCAYANNSAIGVLITNGATGLVMDGGVIEMVNSNSPNKSISSAAPVNIKVYGTSFVRGDVDVAITNIITGTNIIQDANIVVNA